jgi:hypothetical protein
MSEIHHTANVKLYPRWPYLASRLRAPRYGHFEQTGPLAWARSGNDRDVTGHVRRWHHVGGLTRGWLKDVYDQYDRMLILRLDLNLSIVIDSLRHDLRRRDGRDRRSDGCAGAACRAPVAAWFSWRRDEAIPVSPEHFRRYQVGPPRRGELASPHFEICWIGAPPSAPSYLRYCLMRRS